MRYRRMEIPLFFLIVIVLLIIANDYRAVAICPVTSTMDLNNTDSLLYPLDIYGSPTLLHEQQSLNNIFPCYDWVTDNPQVEHSCSTHRFCPVHNENIRDAVKRKTHKGSLCYLASKLNNKSETVRFVIMGGSVPGGCKAKWCTRERRHDEVQFRCSWAYHFGMWLNRSSEANVEIVNLARGAKHSYASSMDYVDVMFFMKMSKFTANDLIMVDFSANDAWRGHFNTVEREFEKLIRTIYSALSDKHSWPTVVVVDTTSKLLYGPKPFDSYTLGYENVTDYYKLPLWSFKDAVRSNYSQVAQKNYVEYLLFNKTQPSTDVHPQWHVHLFIADLFSAVFQTEISHCTLSKSQHPRPTMLPKAFSTVVDTCDPGSISMLSMSYDKVMNNATLGSFNFTDGLWSVREDRKGKGGFIVELLNENSTVTNSSRAVFTLANTTAELLKFGHLRVEILYMRTYKDAGVVYVSTCGQGMERMDTLWKDQISTPDFRTLMLDPLSCKQDIPTIEIQYIPEEVNSWNRGVRGIQKVKIYQVTVCSQSYR